MRKMKLVMVGNGMAGVRTLEELLKLAPDLYDVTVFGAEPHPNYNRILLSPVLAGEQTLEQIVLNDYAWYESHGITLHVGKKIVKIDRVKRVVIADDGTEAAYDRLLLATGSNPFMLPIPGADLDGVLGYRDIADTQAMIDAAARHTHAVVIGGGLLGLEAANGLKLRGMDVTVAHLAPTLLERQLDAKAGGLLRASLEARGLTFLMPKETQALVGDENGRVRAVRFKDGDTCKADLVVMAVGIRPNTALAESAGLYCNRGIVVNDTMQTYDPRIYAVGECVSHRGIAYGLVAPLFEQAKVAANHLAQFGIGRYAGSVTSTKLKVTGIDLFSAGDFLGGGDTEDITLSDPIAGVYKKLVIKDDKIVGACLYGDTADGAWYFKLLREGRNIADIRETLMFGETSLGDTGHSGATRATAMADDAEVCGCNGVCKGTIVAAIKEKGLFTLDDVRKHTKASASCGSCTGLVEQILMSTVGGDYSASPKAKPICGCTDHTHAEVRMAIREHKLLSVPDAMRFLEWRTPNGCASCRPALNYYCISTWPHDAKDDPQSRFINERAHANIQKDGTYSVVPRMWGGVTSADELRRIADVVDKYAIPTVKVTGGQRIDLLGVKKEDLPGVWRDLGMPSGHAYAKALRTVKTCVGSEWCRFGTQDSTLMGQQLERALWRMYAPHKVKLAVSGCPRNCAESGIKDVGVIGVDSGWELYVGGNGGIKTEVAQFFCKVKTHEEVLEYAGAFLQLYREEGWYLERTVHYLERVGLDHVKARVLDDAENRRALWERLQFALKDEPDPWRDTQDAKVDLRQFIPIAVAPADA
ncbi:nitrite reductase large subunit NirB [Burkholderia thailandensis]|uniref:Nitrite reductase [NAD(P)H], large subunit n=1 Tax=Burkholderia thailandensis (strain ATCC 700388 / DSM 13276 / CCUG 48851 / CIP 106301 / E264) TaxID=271848 RepID=Q2T1C7_BURTA|nr:nitrite reductase large subunit NirB [Burkholderia thailandensis]ABC37664.1 nitrite reductase [NAD(P)H], large subunit [Burkholderia thailandensis E264]AHI74245.1 nitrite reductase [NAD(P)H], large subunit [Burkholderia thailandensis 2002721723]AHI79485.1 nitrite reductase [NAD(P)H], large subunit [Burkholderia thailandensis E444]AIC86897.1 nitrite reductase [NAD(P)H], large subunit [Burkholderia thailandensis USAMRU Malaysia \